LFTEGIDWRINQRLVEYTTKKDTETAFPSIFFLKVAKNIRKVNTGQLLSFSTGFMSGISADSIIITDSNNIAYSAHCFSGHSPALQVLYIK
jgi:hypothetical protein